LQKGFENFSIGSLQSDEFVPFPITYHSSLNSRCWLHSCDDSSPRWCDDQTGRTTSAEPLTFMYRFPYAGMFRFMLSWTIAGLMNTKKKNQKSEFNKKKKKIRHAIKTVFWQKQFSSVTHATFLSMDYSVYIRTVSTKRGAVSAPFQIQTHRCACGLRRVRSNPIATKRRCI